MQQAKRALISVSDKTGLIDFARQLISLNISILATGGTSKTLLEAGIKVQEVSDYTGFPEILAGRVKTLHPKIHAGILAPEHQDITGLSAHQIKPIDLVVVNLYPFTETLSRLSAGSAMPKAGSEAFKELIEKIDIGGPTLIRAAAKNHGRVNVVIDPQDYNLLVAQLAQNNGSTREDFRLAMAAKAFQHTAAYERSIADYFSAITQTKAIETKTDEVKTEVTGSQHLPELFKPALIKKTDLRYGENPHQRAAFYHIKRNAGEFPLGSDTVGMVGIAAAKQIQGKPLSFNNMADADAALRCVSLFALPACVIVKHANPCGIGQADTISQAYRLAYQADPVSAYGGIIAFNRELSLETAEQILAQQFVEVIVATAVTQEAEVLLKQKPNLRLLIANCLAQGNHGKHLLDYDVKKISGGLLVQEQDYSAPDDQRSWQVVTERKPEAQELEDMIFAWKAAQPVKSNAIVYAKDGQTLGIGAGQTSRVMSAKLAALQAEQQELSLKGAIMASDAFLPFRDGVDTAAAAGIGAVIQPGGSKRDPEVIEAANQAGMAMVFTGRRHFRH